MTLASRNHCTGCSACRMACPKGAITMKPDSEGFACPDVDADICINCGECSRACPVLNPSSDRKPLAVYAAKALDDEIRMTSSSGGVFTLLSRIVLNQGGVVFGAAIRGTECQVVHQSAEREDELKLLRGSKYVQSDVLDTYIGVKKHLKEGRVVLFSGTPCQVAGLRRFLRRDYAKLICVDVICHGVASPLAWNQYLQCRLSRENRHSAVAVVPDSVTFRNKECGWRKFSLRIAFSDHSHYRASLNKDTFLRAFLANLFLRPSCHDCPMHNLKSGADITLGDFWKVEVECPQMFDDEGVSLVLVNSPMGQKLIEECEDKMTSCVIGYDTVVRVNPALVRSAVAHPGRSAFFAQVKKNDFDSAVSRLLRGSPWANLRRIVKRFFRMSGIRRR